MTGLARDSDPTAWSIVLNAAEGLSEDRDAFALRYEDAVRRYLRDRWRSSRLCDEIDDAVQEVFVECFRRGGVLERIRDRRPESFRKFFRGVVRNVALRHEQRVGIQLRREPRSDVEIDRVAASSSTSSRVFDRAWARALLRQAGRVQQDQADEADERVRRRVTLLRLRHVDGLAIREIAEKWRVEAAKLHKEYATAREEFRDALRRVVRFYFPNSTDAAIEERCRNLLELLQS